MCVCDIAEAFDAFNQDKDGLVCMYVCVCECVCVCVCVCDTAEAFDAFVEDKDGLVCMYTCFCLNNFDVTVQVSQEARYARMCMCAYIFFYILSITCRGEWLLCMWCFCMCMYAYVRAQKHATW